MRCSKDRRYSITSLARLSSGSGKATHARAARQRADLLAFLKEATQPGASVAQQGGPMGGGGMSGMMDGGQVPNLKNLDPADRVQEITYCKDSYTVTTANGQTRKFWERNQAPLVVRRSLSH